MMILLYVGIITQPTSNRVLLVPLKDRLSYYCHT